MSNTFTLPDGGSHTRAVITGVGTPILRAARLPPIWQVGVFSRSGPVQWLEFPSLEEARDLHDRLYAWLNEIDRPATEPLYQFPEGDWVDLMDIGSVEAYVITGEQVASVHVKDHEFHYRALISFPDIDAARAYRDELAGLVNKARAAR